jgi:hypothetical protein
VLRSGYAAENANCKRLQTDEISEIKKVLIRVMSKQCLPLCAVLEHEFAKCVNTSLAARIGEQVLMAHEVRVCVPRE